MLLYSFLCFSFVLFFLGNFFGAFKRRPQMALCRFVWNPTPTMAASMRAAGAHDRGVK